MSDASAFFANKKKKKKGFKGFNANKIDAAMVSPTVHVDAPALSTDTDGASTAAATTKDVTSTDNNNNSNNNNNSSSSNNNSSNNNNNTAAEWDDEAMAASYAKRGGAAVGTASTVELLDMKALESKRREQDDIAERMRVEETKAALAAAREGMEREAQRLKEEGQEPERALVAPGEPRKWVPPHMRSGLSRVRMGAAPSQKLDTRDENLFPDLAAADAILEQQQKQQQANKVPKKTAVGGGATWGSRPPALAKPQRAVPKTEAPKPPKVAPPQAPVVVEPKPEKPKVAKKEQPEEQKVAKDEPKKEETTAATGTSEPAAAPPVVKKKKKKKKDVSTFKAS